MKILFVCSGTSKRGISHLIKNQAESLRERGVELDFFTIKRGGVKGYLAHVSILKKHLKEHKYDLIHVHYALCGWVVILAFPGIPVVVSYMGSDVYGDVDKNGKRTHYLNFFLAKLLQPFVNIIIAKSPNIEKYVYLKKKLQIIPNGVNFDRFKPMNREECRKKLGLTLDKNVLFLGNPEDDRKNIKLVRDGIIRLNDDQVQFNTPYHVPHEMVPIYINACNVLVLSSYNEGSPNVVKEAMACNIPVVVTDVGDAWKVIENTSGCFKIDFNPESVLKTLKKALDFDRETTGRQDISHLDEKHIAKKLISIYNKLTNVKKKR